MLGDEGYGGIPWGHMCHADLFFPPFVLPSTSPLSSLLSPAPLQKVLGLLLAHSADVNARDKLWQTPLHVAAANRATKCAEALAPLLSSLNVADRSGRSALHHAVHSGHLEVRTAPIHTQLSPVPFCPGPPFPSHPTYLPLLLGHQVWGTAAWIDTWA